MRKLSILITITTVFFLLAMSITSSADSYEKIDDKVAEELNNQDSLKVIVRMKDSEGLGTQSFAGTSSVYESIESEKISHRFQSSNSFAAELTGDEINSLSQNPNVENIYYDYPAAPYLHDSPTLINATNTWQKQVDTTNLTGTSQTVCIVDTGINYTQLNFGSCDNNTFLNGSCEKVVAGYDFGENDNDPMDLEGHGSHVAGIVAASGTHLGIANNAKIAMAKVFDDAGSASRSNMVAGIDWCVANATNYNISVISISMGLCAVPDCSEWILVDDYCDSAYTDFRDAIDAAVAKNISVTISTGNAGNKTHIGSPSCIQSAIPVASSTKADAVSSFSNRNNMTTLFAPGSLINSTRWNLGACDPLCSCAGDYMVCSGTSMAAPMVAGAIAIINQFLDLTSQQRTPSQIESALNSTGVTIDDSGGSGLNYSRIDVFGAVLSFDNTNPEVNLISPTNSSASLSINQTFTCNATDLALQIASFYLWNSTGVVNITNQTIASDPSEHTFQVNITNLESMDYSWNCLYTDRNNNSAFASANYSLTIGDDSSPTYSGPTTSKPYALTNIINITWGDDIALSTVWIDLNGVNYTGGNITNTSDVYFFNFTGGVGAHNTTWYANDTSGNLNTTGLTVLTISQVTPTLNLSVFTNNTWFNSSSSVEDGTNANLSVTGPAEGSLKLYWNDTLLNEATPSVSNLTNLTAGLNNITAIFNATQNYSAYSLSLFMTVETVTTPPRSSKVSPTNNNYTNQNVTFTINATDASLANATIYVYNLSSAVVYSNTNTITGNFNETSWTSNFSQGNYTWNALVTDTNGNSNMTNGNFSFVMDLTNPSASISTTDNEITTAETANITCTGSDSLSPISLVGIYINTSGTVASSTSSTTISYVYSSPSATQVIASCRTFDLAGNSNEGNTTITVTAVSTPSDTGSTTTSPSSPDSTTTKSEKTSKTFDKVSAGEFVSMNANSGTREATGVVQIYVFAEKTVNDFKITLGKADSVSDPIEEGDEKVFSYIEVDKTSITNGDISKAIISFELEQKWLTSNNLEKDSILMKRYSDGAWEDLETRVTSDGSTIIKLEATTPGFSLFAITAKKIPAGSSEEGTDTEEEKKKFTFPKIPTWAYITAILVATLIIGGSLAYFLNKKSAPAKEVKKKFKELIKK
ncbi:S8 family serine peptidase [Nanoarchaeota archaeon]